MTYRQTYNKAKSLLAQKYNEELHAIMIELGYVKKERKTKEEVEDEVVLTAEEEAKEEAIRVKAQAKIDKIVENQSKVKETKKK